MQFQFPAWLRNVAIGLVAISGLAACGGSDSSSDYSYAYIQFYNASPNGANVEMREVDGDSFGSAQFGDTTAMYSMDNGEIELEFIRTDSDDQEVLIDTYTVNLKNGDKRLIVMSGDFASPIISDYSYTRETLEDHFRLFALSVTIDEGSYDFYLAESGDPFEAANFLGTVTASEMIEFDYWDPDDDSDYFDEDEYTIYLTEPGSTEVIFESQTIDFAYETEYLLTMRDVSGAIQSGLVVDTILNSSSVTALTDVEADSQYRIYNSTNITTALDVTFGGNTDEEDVAFSLDAGELSEFTEIGYGDYRVTVTDTSGEATTLSNKLITLNQGESKAILIYEKAGALGAVTFVESGLPQAYDKTVNFINLVEDFDDVDFYLVRNDETIDTAEYDLQNLEFGETDSEVLPSDYYEIIAVYEDDNEEQILLDRTALFGFTEEENYIVTVEPADTATGYEINILY
ncbi:MULTISPECIES: DUF4397 domain-containing protein [Alteromonas]|jgi:hypothetical protein|uniref:DUF4397 domain-containing protein n=1 Tax=Alteromonas stellipolaris TaxID=233316 RepID=A0AAW7Z214_9ALTE|nr:MULTISPECIES: DUF4397 domain-containing protein [Alteromonas]AMJ92088.1 hypothetical protein AV940_17330 [Alteromonas sp. Mac2]ALM93006.1 hypothetical protein AOR13_4014 [Alteromonas stellipolaris LMG 21856]AMJ75806.1 hypothetical protein AVL57_18660 [Alteromonas stellipolaris]AMJ88231.1 hypothetical protein AV939_17630 [Alteromonas sp. Mac1]AMJ95920.1 hypothetical protein AVL56_17450 [Alteromonas stellipolaris]